MLQNTKGDQIEVRGLLTRALLLGAADEGEADEVRGGGGRGRRAGQGGGVQGEGEEQRGGEERDGEGGPDGAAAPAAAPPERRWWLAGAEAEDVGDAMGMGDPSIRSEFELNFSEFNRIDRLLLSIRQILYTLLCYC